MVTVYAVLVRASLQHGDDFGSRKGSFAAEAWQLPLRFEEPRWFRPSWLRRT